MNEKKQRFFRIFGKIVAVWAIIYSHKLMVATICHKMISWLDVCYVATIFYLITVGNLLSNLGRLYFWRWKWFGMKIMWLTLDSMRLSTSCHQKTQNTFDNEIFFLATKDLVAWRWLRFNYIKMHFSLFTYKLTFNLKMFSLCFTELRMIFCLFHQITICEIFS